MRFSSLPFDKGGSGPAVGRQGIARAETGDEARGNIAWFAKIEQIDDLSR